MTTDLLIKGLFAAIIGGMFSWIVFSRYDAEIGEENGTTDQQRYLPYVPGMVLPLFLAVLVGLTLFYDGGKAAAQMTLSFCFGIFLHISVYYVLLMAVLPLLRRHFSARACATLWMIPNYLYITEQSYMELPMPLFVIQTQGRWIWILFGVWLVGFVGVLGWKLLSHLVFRWRILRNAVAVSDPEVLSIWNSELENANFKKPRFQLVVSPQVSTPLSVGLFQRRIRVVLPDRSYSKEELALIFRHEIVHIGREDSWSKFFLVFCTAMCWFNPLMWIAMRKSADDLELSCDETVLVGCQEDTRHQYANLLLKTAGDERGFTTCLSATASAMRYRLKNVVKPPKKHSGALLVGLVFFALCMSCGYVALAYSPSTGAEVIYQSRDLSAFHLRHIELADDPYNTPWLCPDQEAFHSYMASLELYQLTGNYSFDGSDREFTFLYDTPEGTLGVVLCEKALKLVPLYGEGLTAQWYYISGGTDWERLSTLLPAGPALNLTFPISDSSYPEEIGASLYRLDETKDGQTTCLIPPDEPLDSDANGVFGYDTSEVVLDFSRPLVSDFQVEVKSRDGKTCYSLSQSDLEEPYVLPLAGFAARYTISAQLEGENGSIYEATFRFDVGDV